MKEFGQTLITLRKECKISQQKLAISIGVTQQCISEWEKGNMEPTLSNLVKLSDYFEVSIDYLAGKSEY